MRQETVLALTESWVLDNLVICDIGFDYLLDNMDTELLAYLKNSM